MLQNRIDRRQRRVERILRGLTNLFVHFIFKTRNSLLVQKAFAQQIQLQSRKWIA